nr:MAG TPA: hypothetical protein [Caudoviricetes sp.]
MCGRIFAQYPLASSRSSLPPLNQPSRPGGKER